MTATESRWTPEELAHLGLEVYESRVRPTLRPEDDGKFVAIDVISGDFEIDPNDYAAVTRLRERTPAGDLWLGCVGQQTTYYLRQSR